MNVEFKDNSMKIKNLIQSRAEQLLLEGAIEIKAQASKNTKSKKRNRRTKKKLELCFR